MNWEKEEQSRNERGSENKENHSGRPDCGCASFYILNMDQDEIDLSHIIQFSTNLKF